MEVLIPGGSLICFVDQRRLGRTINMFEAAGPRYWWTLAMLRTEPQQIADPPIDLIEGGRKDEPKDR